jgi:hypothetical protein
MCCFMNEAGSKGCLCVDTRQLAMPSFLAGFSLQLELQHHSIHGVASIYISACRRVRLHIGVDTHSLVSTLREIHLLIL